MIRVMTKEEYTRPEAKSADKEIISTVSEILADVKANGDEALMKYERKFTGKSQPLKVTDSEIAEGLNSVTGEYMTALERSASNIRKFHERQMITAESFMLWPSQGVMTGQKVIPLERVGIYIPGGKASYPSTVLMNVIPAKIAGCREIIIASPSITPEILASAKVSGATSIYRMGGAQAIGAFAYGTQTVPKVDKITGPGNVYVAEAKRQVYGAVDIDMTAGPSEILIVSDETSNPKYIAADMLAQSEHDENASAILVTTSEKLAREVQSEIARQLETLPRKDIASASISNNGAIILVDTVDDAINFANDFAPEHLELCVCDAFSWHEKVRNAGTVFIGEYSPEALGDYYAGTNHTLPTMGTAKFSSPLSVLDFVKTSQYIYCSRSDLLSFSRDIEMMADSEGLTGHSRSIRIRGE